MTIATRFLLALVVGALPALAGAQVFRCPDSTGKLQYSDRACEAGQQSSEVRIHASPAAPVQRMSVEAVAYEKTRQARRVSSDESHQRVDDATARVTQMRADNYDPQKCAEARERMAQIERRDPMYKINISHTMAQQAASLNCGN